MFFFFNILEDKLDNAFAQNEKLSIVMFDIDFFKKFNDTYGHPEGDLSLVYIANVLREFFGEHVFRYGGDEFAIISFADAEDTARKMELVNLRLREHRGEYLLQVCAGVYQSTAQDDERRIFELADSALYEAKHTGKARCVIYRAPAVEA